MADTEKIKKLLDDNFGYVVFCGHKYIGLNNLDTLRNGGIYWSYDTDEKSLYQGNYYKTPTRKGSCTFM